MTQWVKLSDSEWAKVPDDWSIDQIREAVNKSKHFVSNQARSNLDRIKAGGDVPPGVDLQTPDNPGYFSRVGRLLGEAQTKMGTPDISGMNALTGVTQAVTAPLTAAFEQPVRSLAQGMNMAGPETEQFARQGADLASQVVQAAAPLAMPGAPKVVRGVAPEVVDTPKGPIRIQGEEPMLLDPGDGKLIEGNTPPTPDRAMALNEQFGPDGAVAAKKVVTDAGLPEPNVSVGRSPISRSVIGDDGVGQIDLAQGTTDEGVHEGLHVVADSKGTPHPPEDNNAIADAVQELGPKRVPDQYPEGTTFTNRGRTYSVSEYDEATDSYTAADEETGREFTGFSPDAIAAGGAKEPRSSVVLPKSEPKAWNPQGAPPAQSAEDFAKKVAARQPEKGPVLPEQPTALEAENFRTAGAEGPKEAAAQGEIPEGEQLGNSTLKSVGKERKWKPDAVQPLPDTPAPKTPKEVQQRSIAYRALDRLTRAWQVAVTSHPGTASRIFFDNQIRVAIDAGATRSIGGFTGQFQAGRNAALIDELAGIHPEADLARFGLKGQVYEHGGKLGEALSTLTRLADTVPKEAVFVSRLEQTLARRGLKLWDLRESGALNKITLPELADAKYAGDWVGMSLDPKKGTDVQKIVTGLQTPVGRLFVGFGRMIYNRGLSLVQQNPLMYLKVASPEFRAALAARNPEAIKTAILPVVGTAAFAAGYVSAKRGENDPQALKAGMSKVDIGASYLFPMYAAGHALARMGDPSNHGGQQNINEAEMKNLANAVIGIPGGATSLVGAAMEADFADMKKAAANWAGGFSRTVKVVHDFLAAIDPEEAKARDTAGTWYGPFVKNIPWASKQLPEYKSPTKSAPVKQEHPLAEVVGAQIKQADTDVEDEFRRLGIRIPGKVSDDPEKNRAFRDNAGPEIEAAARMIMATKEYKSADDAGKHLQLSRVYQIVRKYAQEQEPVRNIDKKKLLQEQAVK